MSNIELAKRIIFYFRKEHPSLSSETILTNAKYDLGYTTCFAWANTEEGSDFWNDTYNDKFGTYQKMCDFLIKYYFSRNTDPNFINISWV